MSMSTLRRQVKNVACNFSDAQVKVREATSNDPWGPTTALMSEIADMTHNAISFSEIMSMIWRRLNDHGKNWRHVYKSLVLLDYLIKCGSERVAQQCRENMYAIETLKDFQHIEDNRDQGLNIRTKSKQMVDLLKDEERLKNERARFLLTRKRFIQNGSGSAISSTQGMTTLNRRIVDTALTADTEFEEARPASIGEEEMQLQIALALSKEECEKEKELRRGDEIRLQIALEESKRESDKPETSTSHIVNQNNGQNVPSSSKSQSAVDDLLSLGLGSVFNNPNPIPSTSQQASSNDPWSPQAATNSPAYPSLKTEMNDPWSITEAQLSSDTLITNTNIENLKPKNDPWSLLDSSYTLTQSPKSNEFNGALSETYHSEQEQSKPELMGSQRPNSKTPEGFLGENSLLVNLENLMGPASRPAKPATNPFVNGTSSINNPFLAQQRPSPSLNEMMQANSSNSNNSITADQSKDQPHKNPFS